MASLRLATRRSPLALVQARRVAALLEGSHPGLTIELLPLESAGDRQKEAPIREIGGDGAFVVEVDAAVRDGRAEIAVHSAKDLPSSQGDDGLVIAAIPERADPRDALVGRRLDELSAGALVATGAVRRRTQLAHLRPDLGFVELRGNIATRLAKVPRGGAVVVALAALERLGLQGEVAEVLSTSVLLPQVGQGALALRCRADDEAVRRLCAGVDSPALSGAVRAERAFLAALGGGCEAPVGALASWPGIDQPITLEGLIGSEDGHTLVRSTLAGEDPEELGAALAVQLLARCGGRALLAEGRAG